MRTTHKKRIDDENAAAEGVKQNGTGQPDAKTRDDEKPPFWEWLNGLGDRWSSEGIQIYCYRVWPVIDRREEQHYLCKISEPFDEDFLLKNYGSGKYLLQANNRRGKTLHKRVVSVHNVSFPPKVSADEVVSSDPRNETFFSVWGKKSDGTTSKSDRQPSAQTDVNTVLTTVLEKTGSFDPKLAELWEKTARERDDLSKALAEKNAPPDFMALVKSVKELFPSQPASTSDKSELLAIISAIKGIQQDPLAVMQQAKELFAPDHDSHEPPQRTDEIDRLDKVLGFAQKLASLRVSNGGGQRDGWDIGLDFAKEFTPPIIQLLNNYMILRSQAKGGTQPVPGMAGAPPAAFDPYANPDMLRQHARNQAATATASGKAPEGQSAAQTPPMADGTQPQNEIMALLASYGSLVLNALNAGESGADFADSVARLFGTATPALIGNHGEDVLTQSMMAIPELKLFGETRLRRFAYEFCHFEEILESEETERETGPGAAA
jgi:hypothetical protein